MDSGTVVFRPFVGSLLDDKTGLLVTVTCGTVTEIVANGTPLVRHEDGTLSPASEWHASADEALRAAKWLLATRVSVLQSQFDRLHKEMAQ